MVRPVGLLGRDEHPLFLAQVHAGDRRLKAGDDLILADNEMERAVRRRSVEHRPVGQPAGIMHLDDVPLVSPDHAHLPFRVVRNAP
jgi:hypothetical protein